MSTTTKAEGAGPSPAKKCSSEELTELKQAVGIAPYVERLPDLKRKGAEYWTRCPFHNDAEPSFAVYPDKEQEGAYRWSCMSHPDDCGKGDVIDFVRKMEGGISFMRAVRILEGEEPEVEKLADRQAWQYNEDAAVKALANDGEALRYLKSRGISPVVTEEARLGVVDVPGLGKALAIPYGDGVVKFRALSPTEKSNKFRHLPGKTSADLLYGLDAAVADWFTSPDVWVVESELDCLTLRSHGLTAVSVSSATTCLDRGHLKIKSELLKKLEEYDRIIIATDMDEPGEKCASAFLGTLPSYKTYRVKWPYGGKESTDPKDIGEVYAQTLDRFVERLEELKTEAINRPPAWRNQFHTVDELDEGDPVFLIDGFLIEGVTFIGGLSSVGKTWFALSMAKALTTGHPFIGHFDVPKPVNVVYLIPESGEKAFRKRCERLHIPMGENFLCRTLKDGRVKLDDPLLLQAVKALKPVIFLDTAIRFSPAKDENSAKENSDGLSNGVFGLLRAGAQAVVGLHHSSKDAAGKEMTLENVLRGTGDLGAMCDAVYGIQCRDASTFEIKVKCVKPRDFDPPATFRVWGRPYINENGDFANYTEASGLVKATDEGLVEASEVERVGAAIEADRQASYRKIGKLTGINKDRVKRLAKKAGWTKQDKNWEPSSPKTPVN